MSRSAGVGSVLAALLLGCTALASAAEPVQQVRLYTLDCGSILAKELGMFSGHQDNNSGRRILLARHDTLLLPAVAASWRVQSRDAKAAALTYAWQELPAHDNLSIAQTGLTDRS